MVLHLPRPALPRPPPGAVHLTTNVDSVLEDLSDSLGPSCRTDLLHAVRTSNADSPRGRPDVTAPTVISGHRLGAINRMQVPKDALLSHVTLRPSSSSMEERLRPPPYAVPGYAAGAQVARIPGVWNAVAQPSPQIVQVPQQVSETRTYQAPVYIDKVEAHDSTTFANNLSGSAGSPHRPTTRAAYPDKPLPLAPWRRSPPGVEFHRCK